ncbi:DUF4440 domain-containing protein [Guptibacillus hwajinpoensis]|uniref:nuclear transport factor 2 family protein n=1 Tax=Guptibacillus hwajinpoensis TaxID=208199 RepID=UPI001CD215C3|nr:DUF4440 domain-containing protein [Pseudalkalibacillus hwajinpoensis]MCA0990679.1 DUF4440 domain-containing protein [Pseudalkalibacillus hwajinpoensis]
MRIDEIKTQIFQLEMKLLTPQVRENSLKLNSILAADFFEFGSSGAIWSKKDAIEGGLSLREMTLSDFDIHPLTENVVLATYRVYDKTRNQKTLRSSIWRKNGDQWQLFFHQGTLAN